jgi:flagellar capping protein FliD
MSRFSDLVTRYTRTGDGLLSMRVATYKTRVSNMNDQIDTMQRRVDAYESTLRNQFAAMEQLVSRYQSQGSQVAGILAKLNQ